MSPHDEPVDSDVVRGARTVGPVQASALQFAASILGEASYTPDAELKGTLSAPSRVHEEAPAAPVAAPAPVTAPVTAPVPTRQPVQEPRPQTGVVPPVRVGAGTSQQAPAPQKGWFGRLLDKLLGRG